MRRIIVILLLVLVACAETPEQLRVGSSTNYMPIMQRAEVMPRQGIAGGLQWECQQNIEWERRWNWPPANRPCDAGTGAEYERAVVAHIERPDHGNSTWFTVEETARNLIAYDALSYPVNVFWFNEPEHGSQGDQSPGDAMDFLYEVWVLYLDMGGDPAAPLERWFVGGVNIQQCGLDWMAEAFDYWADTYGGEPPRRGFPIHVYADIEPVNEDACPESDRRWRWAFEKADTPEELFSHWQAQLETALIELDGLSEQYDEIWIGEMGCLMPGNSHNTGCSTWDFSTEYLGMILDYLNDFSGPGFEVVRYAWYTDDFPWASLYQSTWNGAEFTPLGIALTENEPLHYSDIEIVP